MTNNKDTEEENFEELNNTDEEFENEDKEFENEDEDTTDYKAEAEKAKAEAEKAKAEASKYRRLFEKKSKQPKVEKKENFNYGEKAYLNSLGFKDKAEQDFIFSEVQSSGKSLEDVTAFRYVKEHIETIRVDKANAEASPKSSKRGNSSTIDTVDYWIKKGELPPANKQELRRKVVNQKIKNENNQSKFGSGKYEVR